MVNLAKSHELEILKEQENFLVARLMDFFRDLNNEDKWQKAAKISLNYLDRLVHNLPKEKLGKRFLFLASSLKNNINPSSIRKFSKECIVSANNCRAFNAIFSETHHSQETNFEKKIQLQINRSLSDGYLPQSAVNKTATKLWRENLEKRRMEKNQKLLQKHPLKDVLASAMMHKKLAREDIRSQFLTLKDRGKPSTLLSVLKKAQVFGANTIHDLLGDELFFLCRPIGFFDAKEEIVLVEVASHAHMNAMAFRKLEILRALKKDSAFIKANQVRFKISSKTLSSF